MIKIYSGLPGAGKTIFTINDVIKNSQEFTLNDGTPRPVYYYSLTFNQDHEKYESVEHWIELDQTDLEHQLPKLLDDEHPSIKQGSIIIIDECQELYRTRRSGDVPLWISFFERHRHTGCDFYLITQNVAQIDSHLRRLVGVNGNLKVTPFRLFTAI